MIKLEDEDHLGKTYDGQLLWRLWAYVRAHSGLLLLSLASLPLMTAFSLVQPYLIKVAIDEHITLGRFDGLWGLGAVFLVALLGEHTVRYGQSMWLGLLGQRAMNALRLHLYQHLFNLRAAFFDRQPVGRLMTRLTSDVESINEAFAAGLITLVGDVVTLLGIVIAMLLLDLKLALFALASAPILFLVAAIVRRFLRDAYREIRRKISRINGFLQEHVSGMKVIQLCVHEAQAAREFEQLNREHRDANMGALGWDAALYAVVEMLGNVAIALLLWWGSGGILSGVLTFGVLVAFLDYLGRFYTPIRDLSSKFTVMQQAMASAERIFKLLDTHEIDAPVVSPRVCERSERPSEASAVAGTVGQPARAAAASSSSLSRIELDGVTFAYRLGETVLSNLSVSVEKGHTLAIVGATGSGKTTVIRLLTRLYEPTSGQIRIFGRDLATIPKEELRRLITVVSQDVFLFSGSIQENIALWDPALTQQAVQEAAERVGLMLALSRRHRQLTDWVGERGVNLSAGERQLVAFARALVRDPEVLVLDEATSNIDPETESLIEQGTAALLRGRTSILIAHRLSTIERADAIVVLHHGHITERGTHAELLLASGVYARLYRLQVVSATRAAVGPPALPTG